MPELPRGFEDLLLANRRYALSAPRNFDGFAHAGVAVVTCMDSRLQPLEMPDQEARLRADVRLLAEHPLISQLAVVGGFHHDVETCLLRQIC